MGQVSKVLRKTDRGYTHWCDGCQEAHQIFTPRWSFNDSVDNPTFNPSVKIDGFKAIRENGRWTGEWVKDENGKPVAYCCHYYLTDGILHYLNDCTHVLAGKDIPLPELPWFLRDD